MAENPQIHFIEAPTVAECEERVNAWIRELSEDNYLCTVLNVNVMPMMMEGKLVFLTVVMYTGQPSYMSNTKKL